MTEWRFPPFRGTALPTSSGSGMAAPEQQLPERSIHKLNRYSPTKPIGSPIMATLSRLPSVCSECGTTYERDRDGSKCQACRPADRGERELYRGSRQSRGYDYRWEKLARRARELQPFCSDCGATDDLTGDHSSTAWERRAAGKAIRLRDIDVVCRRCNGERGAARGVTATDEHRPSAARLDALMAELDRHRGGTRQETD